LSRGMRSRLVVRLSHCLVFCCVSLGGWCFFSN
jgi:hypothetical protein